MEKELSKKRLAYDKYILSWLHARGLSLSDWMEAVLAYQQENPEDKIALERWELYEGFRNEVYACFNEFSDNEYQIDESPTKTRMYNPIQEGFFMIDSITHTEYPEYPGVDIEFISESPGNWTSRPRILFEKPEGEDLRVLIWADVNEEDYTDEIIFNQTVKEKKERGHVNE